MKEVNSVSDATNIYGEDIKLTTTDEIGRAHV